MEIFSDEKRKSLASLGFKNVQGCSGKLCAFLVDTGNGWELVKATELARTTIDARRIKFSVSASFTCIDDVKNYVEKYLEA